MPQKDLLLPWRTVLDNVILGMEVSGTSRAEARREARGLMSGFGLAGFESSYPYELSGGMRQRAAFLRTVLFRRDILLLDEPFGALDALTRTAMHEWLLEVWGKLGQTILFVTHDVEEAVLLSDRVYVMTARPGRIKAEVTIDLPVPGATASSSTPVSSTTRSACSTPCARSGTRAERGGMSTQKKSLPASMAGLPPGGWGMSRAVSAANRYALSAVLALAALIIWQAVSFFGSIEPWLLPSPGEVLESFADDTSLIFRHAWVTAQEALLGFLIAVAVGFGLALGITSFRAFEKAVYPYVIASQAVPIIAIAPVLVVWFGFGLMPKIIVIVLITFFPVAINTVDGLRNVDPDMMTLMRTMGASRWQVFRLVRLPSALPLFFSGVKIAAAVSVIGAVLANGWAPARAWAT